MDSKRIERILWVIVLLLVLNILVNFRPYQIAGTTRLNVYTGDMLYERHAVTF